MPLLYGVVFVDLPDAVLPLLNLYKQLYKNRRWLCGFLFPGGWVWEEAACGVTAANPWGYVWGPRAPQVMVSSIGVRQE